jgi:hypothetical protein
MAEVLKSQLLGKRLLKETSGKFTGELPVWEY